VKLETRWDRVKVEWSYMCQVCPLLRKIATVVFFSETKFEYHTNDSRTTRTTGDPFFLRRLNPDYIGLIRYLSISFSDGGFIQTKSGRTGRQPFSELPGHLEILSIFATHGNLKKAEIFFSTSRQLRKDTQSSRAFIKLLKSVKVDEVDFPTRESMLGGEKQEWGVRSKNVTELADEIKQAMGRKA